MKNVLSRYTPPLRRFFESALFPLLTGGLVLAGYVTGTEFYLTILLILLASLSLLTCETVTPLITLFCTFVYQVSLRHTPGEPARSQYYFSGAKLVVVVILALLFVASFAAFFYRKRRALVFSVKKTPLLLPLLVLSAAFLLGGLFSPRFSFASVAYGFFNLLVYLVLFYLFYFGFAGEDPSVLLRAVTRSALAILLVLFGETLYVYLTYDNILADGKIVKEAIQLGWGIWNPLGLSFAVLIPVLFLGVMRERLPWLYFAGATLSALGAVLSMSRNALIAAAVFYPLSLLIACFRAEKARKLPLKLCTGAGILLVIALAVLFREKLSSLLSDYLSRGLSDNGRFDLWKIGIADFLENPVFGVGFFGFESETVSFADFLPQMAHDTFVELLAALGAFGFLAYLFYRVKTLRPFLRHPTTEKTMLGLSILVLLLESLLDNFVFYIYPCFFYTVCLAAAFRLEKYDEPNPREI